VAAGAGALLGVVLSLVVGPAIGIVAGGLVGPLIAMAVPGLDRPEPVDAALREPGMIEPV
jgi:hypothetical protein